MVSSVVKLGFGRKRSSGVFTGLGGSIIVDDIPTNELKRAITGIEM